MQMRRKQTRTTLIAMMATLVGLSSAVTFAVPAASAIDDRRVQDQPDRRGGIVIETTDPSIDPDDPRIVSAVEAVRREQAIERAGDGAENTGRRASLSSPGISVVYQNSPPAGVQRVVDAAARDWNDVLTTNPQGPVVIRFDWRALNTGVLGFAGPTEYVLRPDDFFYPVALANSLDGRDYVPNNAEIEVTISSVPPWYIDAGDAPVPANGLDLYTTVLHEMGHGLGFLGSARQTDKNSPPMLEPVPDKYDDLVHTDGVPILSLGNPNAVLTNGKLDIAIGGGLFRKLWAPALFQTGSSYSHFDENIYGPGKPGALMTPSLDPGESARRLDGPTLGVLAESGWGMDRPPATPAITAASFACNTIKVSFAFDLTAANPPPQLFRVTASDGAGSQATVDVAGSATSADLTGLANGQTYDVAVQTVGRNALSPPTTASFRLSAPPSAPSLVNVAGDGLARTVSWVAADSCGDNITEYDVEVATNGGAFVDLAQSTGTSLQTGPLTNAVHQFRVRARNASGFGPYAYALPAGFSETVVRPFPLDGELARLYQAFFDRLPDPAGMNFYLQQRATPRTLVSIAEELATSTEFVQTYGSLSSRQFVERLYLNVFGRPGEPAGVDYWTGQLDQGRTQGDIVVGFSQSPEFVKLTKTASLQAAIDGAVYRLYLAYFLRPADADGAAYWTGEAIRGVPLTIISGLFADSAEFVTRYGSLSNEQFLQLIYANVLTRPADGAGYEYWRGQLNDGVSRGDVMLAFSNSVEFIIRTGTTP